MKFISLILLFLILFSTNVIFVLAQDQPSNSCSTLEAKINALNAQTRALETKVDSVESTIRTQENQTRTSITEALLNLPVVFIEKTLNILTFGILGFGTDVDIFSLYEFLYVATPDLTPLEAHISELSIMLLEVYIVVIVLYSLWLLYSGAVGRVVLKENLARIIIGAIFLRSSFSIYSITVGITRGITQLFVRSINFNILTLSTKTALLNLDVITIFLVVFIILGLVLGAAVYVTTFFGLLVFPLIIFMISTPWDKVRSFGESLLSGIIGILLAPALSASILAVIPFALQSTNGLESIVINRAILLAGILLAIIFPTFLIISLILKPVVKVAAVTKIVKMVV